MNIITRLVHYFAIIGLVLLSFKPWLPQANNSSNSQSTSYTAQVQCPTSRLAAAISCASTAYFAVLENLLSHTLIGFFALSSFISFLLATLVSSTFISRLFRPPIIL